MSKFGRNYKLTITTEDGEQIIVSFPLTLDIFISRADLASAGNATFRIYNLNQNHRGRIYKPLNSPADIAVRLEAGYGKDLKIVFDGFIREAKSYRTSGQNNFVTEIAAYDSAMAMPTKSAVWGFESPNNTFEYIIPKLCQDLDLPLGSMKSFSGPYLEKGTFCKPAWEALVEVTGGNCFIDNGKVYCLKDGDVIEGPVSIINSASGLLGSPKMNGEQIVFDLVFEPSLQTGQQVNLQSDAQPQWNGVYKVISIEHSGTISGAVGGRLKTMVGMLRSEKNNPLSLVPGGV